MSDLQRAIRQLDGIMKDCGSDFELTIRQIVRAAIPAGKADEAFIMALAAAFVTKSALVVHREKHDE